LKNNCIISQIHIPAYDPQGSLASEAKKKIIDLSIAYTRRWNPDVYLVLTGHGEEPLQSTIDNCDYVNWEELHPLDSGGSVIGSPAQYHSVSKGVRHAKEQGYTHCFKVRGDGIVATPNMVDFGQAIIKEENTKILLTQQTGDLYKFGDCYMYGEIDLLDEIWSEDSPVFHADGLRHTGAGFVKYFAGAHPPVDYDANRQIAEGKTWRQLLKAYASFRNLTRMNIMDMRWNYHTLESHGWEAVCERVLNNTFEFDAYIWGTSNGWHTFGVDGDLINNGGVCSWAHSEKTFYG